MRRVNGFLVLCAVSISLNAAPIIDVYGTNVKQSEVLMKNYDTRVGEIEYQFMEEIKKISNGAKDDYFMKVILPKRIKLINKIKKQYGFTFVNFDTIFYPNDKNFHTTIEVVEQKDKNRHSRRKEAIDRFITINTTQ